MFAGGRQLAGIFLALVFFQQRKVRKMKSIYLLFSAVLVATTTVSARAAAQGVEQALVSIAVEYGSKVLRATTRAFPNINFLWPA
jgi:SpoU rRNA methylase family enzyme